MIHPYALGGSIAMRLSFFPGLRVTLNSTHPLAWPRWAGAQRICGLLAGGPHSTYLASSHTSMTINTLSPGGRSNTGFHVITNTTVSQLTHLQICLSCGTLHCPGGRSNTSTHLYFCSPRRGSLPLSTISFNLSTHPAPRTVWP